MTSNSSIVTALPKPTIPPSPAVSRPLTVRQLEEVGGGAWYSRVAGKPYLSTVDSIVVALLAYWQPDRIDRESPTNGRRGSRRTLCAEGLATPLLIQMCFLISRTKFESDLAPMMCNAPNLKHEFARCVRISHLSTSVLEPTKDCFAAVMCGDPSHLEDVGKAPLDVSKRKPGKPDPAEDEDDIEFAYACGMIGNLKLFHNFVKKTQGCGLYIAVAMAGATKECQPHILQYVLAMRYTQGSGLLGPLLDRGDPAGMTALHYAVRQRKPDYVTCLLEIGASPDAVSGYPGSQSVVRTPLEVAVLTYADDIVDILLAAEGHREVSDALNTCCRLRREDLFVKLWQYSENSEHPLPPSTKNALLMQASANGSAKIVKLLIESGADPNHPCDANKRTAIHAACINGHPKVLEILLMFGGKDSLDIRQERPFHLAAGNGNTECVGLLLKYKFPHQPPQADSLTAPKIAALCGHPAIQLTLQAPVG